MPSKPLRKKPLTKKTTVRTEPVVAREPKDKPKCPLHDSTMRYVPVEGVWKCPVETCTQYAFPPRMLEQGKPIIGEGRLELVYADDPDGAKAGRIYLRAAESNILIDITDAVVGDPEARIVLLNIPDRLNARTR